MLLPVAGDLRARTAFACESRSVKQATAATRYLQQRPWFCTYLGVFRTHPDGAIAPPLVHIRSQRCSIRRLERAFLVSGANRSCHIGRTHI